MARWLSRLTHDHHFRLEVCFRAVSLLDSFLSIMKVKGWGMISFNREEDFMCITRAMGSGKGLPRRRSRCMASSLPIYGDD